MEAPNNTIKAVLPPLAEEIRQLVQQAQQGNTAVLPRLRELLDERQELWKDFGDLSLHAQGALVKLVGGTDLMLTECIWRKLAALRAELAGPTPTRLEQLLVDRVACSWLQSCYFDALLGQSKGASAAQLQAIQRSLTSAHNRFLSAAKSLTLLRKLLIPSRSPIEIATALQGNGRPSRRNMMPAEGVRVEN
jgi:hypothetical protein